MHSITKHPLFFISREVSVIRKDLRAPTFAGPPQLYQGSGHPSCTTPWQPTINDYLTETELKFT